MQIGKDNQDENRSKGSWICEYLNQKREAFRLFLNATTSLKHALEAEDQERIEAFLELRETCIQKINMIERCIERLSQESPGDYASLSPDQKEKIRELTGSIETILDQVKDINKECMASASQRIKMIQDGMSKTVRNRHGLHGRQYGNNQAPRFLDICS